LKSVKLIEITEIQTFYYSKADFVSYSCPSSFYELFILQL